MPEPAKRRALRIIVKKIPVTVHRRRYAGQHRRNSPRAEAQYRTQRLTIGQHVHEKISPFHILPAEGINQYKYRYVLLLARSLLRQHGLRTHICATCFRKSTASRAVFSVVRSVSGRFTTSFAARSPSGQKPGRYPKASALASRGCSGWLNQSPNSM